MSILDKETQSRIDSWLTNEYDEETVAQVQKLTPQGKHLLSAMTRVFSLFWA